jgi:signal transduction histidine kinase
MKKIFLLTLLAVFFCTVRAAEPQKPATTPVSDDPFWQEESADNFPKMPEERITQFLEQLRKENPVRADELEKLRKEKPDEFRNQLQVEFMKQMRQRRNRPEGQQGPESRPGPGGPGGGHWRERMEKMHNDFIAWLEKNYPEQAEALKPLREKEPEEYTAKAMDLMRKYEPIMRAEKNNPKLAQAMKDDLELQKQRDTLLREIHSAKDKEREKLIAELKDNVARRFDVIMTKKQLQYDDLKKRLEELQKEVKMREGELDKLKTTKDKAVAEHLNELISQAEKVQWD